MGVKAVVPSRLIAKCTNTFHKDLQPYRLLSKTSERCNDITFLSSVICAKFPSITTLDQIQTFYCTPNILGRYVRLEITQEWLQVCVMQVFGHSMWLILVIINIPWKIFRNRYTVLKNRIPVSKHDNNPFDKVFVNTRNLSNCRPFGRAKFYFYDYVG